MPVVKDRAGQFFGRLLLVAYAGRLNNKTMWICRCECGESRTLAVENLVSGATVSCGCHRKKILDKTSHGLAGKRAYNIWKNIVDRCRNPNNRHYADYGGRGVDVCDEWLDVTNFYRDMGDPPDGRSIERLDNNLGYSKDNCVWATDTQQRRNKRSSRLIEYAGMTMCQSDWAKLMSIPVETLFARVKRMGAEVAIASSMSTWLRNLELKVARKVNEH
jgi:hypothetical protein